MAPGRTPGGVAGRRAGRGPAEDDREEGERGRRGAPPVAHRARGRPADLAAKTITEAVSFSETESRDKKLVEIVARDLPDLLAQLDGRTIAGSAAPTPS